MSVGTKLLQAAAGNAGEAVYVDDLFSADLWEGNNATLSVTNGIDFTEGGLVWIKNRGKTENHILTDTTSNGDKFLSSNTTTAYTNFYTGGGSDESFTLSSTGFSSTASDFKWNNDGYNYVGWSFRKQEKFFDIVTFTGDGALERNISHNLGSSPGMVIVKRTDSSTSGNWAVGHRGYNQSSSRTGSRNGFLNLSDNMNSSTGVYNFTATTFSVTDSGNKTNISGATYVAYLFAHNDGDGGYGKGGDEDIIKCGSYTGNGSTGQFINLGFEPQFLLIKSATSSHDWYLADTMRGMANTDDSTAHKYLYAQAVNAEESYASRWRTESTGFHLTTAATGINGSSNTYIYMAIARPNKPASEFAANKLFSMDGAGNASGDPDFVSNDHVVDMAFLKLLAGTESAYLTARLNENQYMNLAATNAEATDGALDMDFQSGFGDSASSAVANYQAWMFRRAKGFFDVVTYSGDGTNGRTVTHNLGAVPELYIVKRRSSTGSWYVYSSATGNQGALRINADSEVDSASALWNSTSPTASVFSVSSNQNVNASSHNYIAYLFATVAGISKVGSYTGTGSDLNVDCGFSAGARFVLIKRTDLPGDWYVFDSERGIVAGDDPYFLLNSTAAQVTNTDYIDPLSSGFTVTSSAPAGLNASSGNYIFLAIA